MDAAVDVAEHRSGEAAEQPLGTRGDGLEHRLRVRRRAGDDLEDIGGRRLPFQRLAGLIEQPRVLDGDRRLIGEALLKRQFIVGEWCEVVAENDERPDRGALAPQRRACDGTRALGARLRHRPIGHRGIDIVEIRNMDLPVFTEHRSGQVAASDLTLFRRHHCADTFGAGADPDQKAPIVTVDSPDRDTRRIKQARRDLGDPLQRRLRIARSVGDGAEDFRAGVLPLAGDAQFIDEPAIFRVGRGRLCDRFVVRGETGFEPLLEFGNQPVEIGQGVRGKRGHSHKSVGPWRVEIPDCPLRRTIIERVGRQCHSRLKTSRTRIPPRVRPACSVTRAARTRHAPLAP